MSREQLGGKRSHFHGGVGHQRGKTGWQGANRERRGLKKMAGGEKSPFENELKEKCPMRWIPAVECDKEKMKKLPNTALNKGKYRVAGEKETRVPSGNHGKG